MRGLDNTDSEVKSQNETIQPFFMTEKKESQSMCHVNDTFAAE